MKNYRTKFEFQKYKKKWNVAILIKMYDNFHIVYSIIDSIRYALVKIYAAITFFLKKNLVYLWIYMFKENCIQVFTRPQPTL